MLLPSSIIVFAGTFASWKIDPLPKNFFLWFALLSTGVFGFFISIDMFTMFMFYEVALIPMYLLIGVWGTGRKEYSAMRLSAQCFPSTHGAPTVMPAPRQRSRCCMQACS